MLTIRLRRMGATNAPYYRVVVADSRRTPKSRAIEEIGFYSPARKPAQFEVDRARVEHWVARGAQLSETLKRLLAAKKA